MASPREYHTATLLPDGRVLVAGGGGPGGRLRSAELYDPATGTWTSAGDMIEPRYFHTATLLPDGRVLVAGKYFDNSTVPVTVKSTELYNPATGTWSSTGSMIEGRYWHTATLLLDGRVLVAGGQGYTGNLRSAELYDPVTETWSSTAGLNAPNISHTATRLLDGRVLTAGGHSAATEYFYFRSDEPAAPGRLIATPDSARQGVALNWIDHADNETSFDIERATATAGVIGPFAPIGSAAAQAVFYGDGSIAPNTYAYRVYALNAAGRSRPSNVAIVTTPRSLITDASRYTLLPGACNANNSVKLIFPQDAQNFPGFTGGRRGGRAESAAGSSALCPQSGSLSDTVGGKPVSSVLHEDLVAAQASNPIVVISEKGLNSTLERPSSLKKRAQIFVLSVIAVSSRLRNEQIKKIIEDSYDDSKEETLRAIGRDFYSRRFRSAAILTWSWSILFIALATYSAIQFFKADQTQAQIMYAALFVLGAHGVGLMKILAWALLFRLVIRRELKRLEMSVAELSQVLKSR